MREDLSLKYAINEDEENLDVSVHAFFEPGGETQTKVQANSPSICVHLDYSDSQILPSEDFLYKDHDFPIETYPL